MAVAGISNRHLGSSIFVEHSNLHFGVRDLLQYFRVDWIVVSQPDPCGCRNRRFLGGLLRRRHQLP